MCRLLAVLIFVLVMALAPAQELGLYVDKEGKLHITDSPRAGWKKANPDDSGPMVKKTSVFSVRSVPDSTPYSLLINEASKKYGIDGYLIRAVISVESSFNPDVVSSAEAKGLMQLMDPTAQMLGVSNSFDPRQNIMGGSRYLRNLLKIYNGDLRLALAAYNAGQGAVSKHGGVPPYKETIRYLEKIAKIYTTLDYHISTAEMESSLVVARALAHGRTAVYRYETANGYALSEMPPHDRDYYKISIVD